RYPILEVAHEDVLQGGVSCHEIARAGREGDVAAIPADRGVVAVAVCEGPADAHAHLGRGTSLAVTDEDVKPSVVRGHQVGGAGFESDVAAVAADRGGVALIVCLDSAGTYTHPCSAVRVVHEQISAVVAI